MKKGWKAIGSVVAVFAVVALLRGCVATSYLIPSEGMENSLYRGERILVNKWSYGLRLPLMSVWGYRRWQEQPVQPGDIIVFNNPANRKQKYVDRREVFISRCVASPGDTLLVDEHFNTVPSEQVSPDRQLLFAYPKEKEQFIRQLLHGLGIESDTPVGTDSLYHIRNFSRYEHYLIGQANTDTTFRMIPLLPADSTLHPLVVPRRGISIEVQPWNCALLCNTLLLHEGKRAAVKGDTLLIDGKPVTHCRFSQDYHWVVSNNPTNPNDSRLFGFVPKNHIIGKAAVVWFSRKWKRIGSSIQ